MESRSSDAWDYDRFKMLKLFLLEGSKIDQKFAILSGYGK
jgi:hypothetical protein